MGRPVQGKRAMLPFCRLRHSFRLGRCTLGGLAALVLLSLMSTAPARALPVPPVHPPSVTLPPVTLHSMEALQSEIVDARSKSQRDRQRSNGTNASSFDTRIHGAH